MVGLVAVLLLVAVVAAISGFAGLVIGAVAFAKILFWIFLMLFLVVLVMSLVTREGTGTVP